MELLGRKALVKNWKLQGASLSRIFLMADTRMEVILSQNLTRIFVSDIGPGEVIDPRLRVSNKSNRGFKHRGADFIFLMRFRENQRFFLFSKNFTYTS